MSAGATTSKSQWPFSPQSIPGLSLWLDGADTSTITGTSTVTAWKDKSGNGYSFTKASYSGGTITLSSRNGNSTVNLGSNAMTISSFPWTRWNTMFFVVSSTEWIYNVGDLASYFSTGNWSLFNNGQTFQDANISQGTQLLPTLGLTNQYCLLVIGYGGGTQASNYTVNGTVRFTTAGTSTGNGTINPGSALSQATITAPLWLNGGQFFAYGNSTVAEIVHYNSELTTSQRQQVEGYLAQKWGLQVNLPQTHPYYATTTMQLYQRPVFQRTFQPVDIPGLQLWLDAADRNSITFSSGSNVSSWNDKSGNARNMSTTANFPVYTETGVQFTGSTPTVLSNAGGYVPSNIMTSFVVYRSTVAGTRQRYVTIGTNGNTNIFAGDTTFITAGTTSLNNYQGPISYSQNTTYLISQVGYSAGSISWAINGTESFTWTVTAGPSPNTRTGIIVGGEDTVYFTGFIMEVLMFDAFFTQSQRQQVESYLAWKWGLVSPLATGHPGKLLPSFSTVFTPKSVTGLSLWLDAADSSSITGTSTVTAWADKSGNGNNGIPISSGPTLVQNVQNGLPGITFPTTASIMLCGNILTGTNFSMLAVVKYASSGYQYASGEWKVQYGSGLLFTQPNSVVTTVGTTSTYNPFGQLAAADTTAFHIYAASLTSSTSSSSVTLIAGTDGNDTTYTNSNGPNSAATAQPFAVGGAYESGTGYYPLTGYMCEVIVYNSALSKIQLQQIEGYLAWKWGLQNNLPDTHAYKKIKP